VSRRALPDTEANKALRALHRSNGLRTRVFVVSGPHTIAGKSKGEVVELELTDDQADALIKAGHIVERGFTIAFDGPPTEPFPVITAEMLVDDEIAFPTEYSTPGFMGTTQIEAADLKSAKPGPKTPYSRKGK